MIQKETYAEKMVRVASNAAELTFTKYAGRLYDEQGNFVASDNVMLNMLMEAYLRGSQQATTDKFEWIQLSQQIDTLFP